MALLRADKARKQQRIERRKRVWELRAVHGWSQEHIAQELNINQSTVSRDVASMEKQVLGNLNEVIENEKMIQISLLQKILEESLDSWQLSRKRHTEVHETKERLPVYKLDGTVDHYTELKSSIRTVVVEQIGNTSYLNAAMKAMSDIRDILGMNKTVVEFDWKKQAADLGLDVSQEFESLVQKFYEQLQDGQEGITGGNSSPDDGSGPKRSQG